ncbi:hypothetical protein [Natrarchaeobaculum aegyptiacum]|uniref:Uncharacterized protein n=1 Tax=Natrarchaeobaculum aegyptiacum TaxID=745377 RepID=A0A2Z2HR71_9EURY|nr:hypothetical protein [Natrarchaeobaculum aegyptiacum]ARS89532.1 hypothetical protein B1756_07105 [Natrarchaeobaculum aegyptiacum]
MASATAVLEQSVAHATKDAREESMAAVEGVRESADRVARTTEQAVEETGRQKAGVFGLAERFENPADQSNPGERERREWFPS